MRHPPMMLALVLAAGIHQAAAGPTGGPGDGSTAGVDRATAIAADGARPDAAMASAPPRGDGVGPRWPRPTYAIGVGAQVSLFLVYELPGPWLTAAARWPIARRLELVAGADAGLLYATGSTRFTGSLGGAGRLTPAPRVPIWLQLGLGVSGFTERMSVVFPDRAVRTTDVGAALTGDVAIGVRVRRWQLALAWKHQLVSTEPEEAEIGTETLRHRGTLGIAIGRDL